MNKEILYEILNSKSEMLSVKSIEAILDEELDKSPDEMDMDLIELCLDALESVDKQKVNKGNYKVRLTKVLIAAVIFVVMIGVSIPVCANLLSINVPSGIVSIYKDFFKIDISNTEYVDNIYGQLELDGISDPVLPEIVLIKDTKISNYEKSKPNDSYFINFDFENESIVGHVALNSYKTKYDFSLDNEKEVSEFDKIEYLYVNDIEIVVLGNENYSYIRYGINNIEYNIFIYNNFETACQIAKTV